jgi:hypothetical protein
MQYLEPDLGGALNALDSLRRKCRRVAACLRRSSRGGVTRRAARAMRFSAASLVRAARRSLSDTRNIL